jgi:hypothetical protein
MPRNHLEDLIAEWYEFQGFFVRRNVQVGKRRAGGYECELDIVALHPDKKRLVQLEPSLDTLSWAQREKRFRKKFDAGKKHIPGLFQGIELPAHIEQIAVLVYASSANHQSIGGGRLVLVKDLLPEIFSALKGRRLEREAIPEHLPILRSFQFVAHCWPEVSRCMSD